MKCRPALVLLVGLVLAQLPAGCGVKGDPEAPQRTATR